MTLGELRELLTVYYGYLPDDTEVLLASDEEGNQINPLRWVGEEKYINYAYLKEINILHPDDVPDFEENPDVEVKRGLGLWP